MIAMSILQVVTIALPAAIGLADLAWGVISWRSAGSKLEAELAAGQIDYSDGLLSVEFISGKSSIMTVSNSGGKRISTQSSKSSKRRNKKLQTRLIKEAYSLILIDS
jgi:hypothetical protein